MDDPHYHSYHILLSLDNHVSYVYLSYNIHSIFYSHSRIFCELELALYERFCNDSANDLSCEWDTHFRNLHPFSSLVLVVWVEWHEKVPPSLVDNVGLAGNLGSFIILVISFMKFTKNVKGGKETFCFWNLILWCPSTLSACCMVAWQWLDWPPAMNQNMLTRRSKQGSLKWTQSHTAGRTTCTVFQYRCKSI